MAAVVIIIAIGPYRINIATLVRGVLAEVCTVPVLLVVAGFLYRADAQPNQQCQSDDCLCRSMAMCHCGVKIQ